MIWMQAASVGLRQFTAPFKQAARGIMRGSAMAALLAAGIAGLSDTGHAQTRLDGSWSGGGAVIFASGARERASCRAHFRRAGRTSYSLRATCATASGRASQTATVHLIGSNRYQGRFYNSEYDFSGTISIVVRGNSQSVYLSSSTASASIRLSR
jgi:hypothetical protein